ncbi:MAG TPA: PA2779 family protein [Gammaproteobacteria bacterium]
MRNAAVSFVTLLSFLAGTLAAPVAHAGIITTESWVLQSQADAERDKVARMLGREDVREQMLAMGVDPSRIEARLAGLSDAEVAQLSTQMEALPAGAGVIEVLLFVVLVFVILDIAGVTDVFPFIDSAN